MADQADRELLRALKTILRASAASGAAFDFRLAVLELAWITLAEEARSAALPFPGGVSAERQRQLEQLERMAALVRGGEPDRELERLYHEGDAKGFREHLHKRRDAVAADRQDDEGQKKGRP
jgi:hypothetical protein